MLEATLCQGPGLGSPLPHLRLYRERECPSPALGPTPGSPLAPGFLPQPPPSFLPSLSPSLPLTTAGGVSKNTHLSVPSHCLNSVCGFPRRSNIDLLAPQKSGPAIAWPGQLPLSAPHPPGVLEPPGRSSPCPSSAAHPTLTTVLATPHSNPVASSLTKATLSACPSRTRRCCGNRSDGLACTQAGTKGAAAVSTRTERVLGSWRTRYCAIFQKSCQLPLRHSVSELIHRSVPFALCRLLHVTHVCRRLSKSLHNTKGAFRSCQVHENAQS